MRARASERDSALDHPFELPDIARPGIQQHRVGSVGRQRQAPQRAVSFEEVVGELEDVGSPFAERRDADVDAAQPVVEVGPEQVLFDEIAEAPVGGRDDTDVDAVDSVASHALHGEILDGAEQFGLRRCGDRSDTSSRNSVPPSACSNLPRRPRTPVAVRSSIPNNSASSSVSTSAAQLMATNGPLRRRLEIVDLPGDQFLSDAALAFEEDGEIGPRNPLDRRPEAAHRGRRADERRRAVATRLGTSARPARADSVRLARSRAPGRPVCAPR